MAEGRWSAPVWDCLCETHSPPLEVQWSKVRVDPFYRALGRGTSSRRADDAGAGAALEDVQVTRDSVEESRGKVEFLSKGVVCSHC